LFAYWFLGPDKGGYYHEMFRREDQKLAQGMERTKNNKNVGHHHHKRSTQESRLSFHTHSTLPTTAAFELLAPFVYRDNSQSRFHPVTLHQQRQQQLQMDWSIQAAFSLVAASSTPSQPDSGIAYQAILSHDGQPVECEALLTLRQNNNNNNNNRGGGKWWSK